MTDPGGDGSGGSQLPSTDKRPLRVASHPVLTSSHVNGHYSHFIHEEAEGVLT